MKERIIEISKKLGLTHISSCLSTLPILEEIYSVKQPDDLVLLDNAHAHLAHLMFTNPQNAEFLIKKYGTHCDVRAGCVVSGGSLGHAIGIGIGIAFVNRKRNVYVIASDGSMQEGSNWEALRIKKELGLTNLRCYFNFNGYSALSLIDLRELSMRVLSFCPNANIRFTQNGEGYEGVQGHYTKAK